MLNVIIIFLAIFIPAKASGDEIAVVVNDSLNIKEIDHDKLLDIYMLNIQKWEDGQKIILCDLKNEIELKKQFYKHLGKKSYEFRKIWIRAQLTGEGDVPATFSTEQAMIKKIESTPGAIGYMSAENVPGSAQVIYRFTIK
ncbi:hypothetical protein GF337_15150 [candidate division KSB1 bacterium]|nr:hypothetical protein [candidate division KSB1 bacterium]